MTQQDMMIYGVAALAFIAVAGLGLAFAGGGSEHAAKKRAKQISTGQSGQKKGSGRKENDDSAARRKETQKMLAKLRQEDEKRRKSVVPQNIKGKIEQAGLKISPSAFWIISAISGVVIAGLVFMSGADGLIIQGISFKSRPAVVTAAGLAGFLGLPRWVLGFLAKSRAKKITNQFADALDIIVRGVKSGLPLTECLRIIARESPAPLGPEFEVLTDSVSMGTNMERALQNLYRRVPLPEINFFVIVLSIQTKAGGNLSEALGNLSAVIRSRRMMREKVAALSSEAKSSAMIIGALPFAVGTMVYITTPAYIMKLFTTDTGHLILASGAALMITGTTVMRKMINFDM
ncbi:MAG: type II secretion system F family protein [Pseudomonadota bacterium]